MPEIALKAVSGCAQALPRASAWFNKAKYTIMNLDNGLSSSTEKKYVYQTVSPRKGFA